MNIWDYIAKCDVMLLSDSEYESLRNYLKMLGHQVRGRYGNRSGVVHECFGALSLDDDGNLAWFKVSIVRSRGGSRVPLTEVKRMAQLGMVE